MKLLSIAVPCYNSEAYMSKCIDSLLVGGNEVEIIIVDDGSTDRTAEIADTYAAEYPDIIKVVHKKNGGHGSAVNAGIENATGLYFKVVDSDDWVKEIAYRKILTTIEELMGGDERVDMLKTVLSEYPNIEVLGSDGLLVDIYKELGCNAVVRGIRSESDFRYEAEMALANRMLYPEYDVVLLPCRDDLSLISSSIVKEVAMYGGDISAMVPGQIVDKVNDRLRKGRN